MTEDPKSTPMDNGLHDLVVEPWKAAHHFFRAFQTGMAGFTRYANEFAIPYLLSTGYFRQVELERLGQPAAEDTLCAYLELLGFNGDLFGQALTGASEAAGTYLRQETGRFIEAFYNTLLRNPGESLAQFAERMDRLMQLIVYDYPKAISDIEPEYGFHFERGTHPLVAETDRFLLYQITPTDPSVAVRQDGKPVVILPPYVLGANILGFLPGEKRSYVHCYANQGIPTYIRILKDIAVTEALQTMTGEDDARDTRLFCEVVRSRHGKPVTLNGYCQGGFSALCNILCGELDGLVDAFITCVSPMDGTRSKGLAAFLRKLPGRFNDLAYGTKQLPNGNIVADGKLMGWVYKLRSIDRESPIAAFFRDLMMFSRGDGRLPSIGKTAAALNYWLNYERNDLPLEITRMSFSSYNHPIAADGTLPVRLFGKTLNLHRLAERKIPWLICYGLSDDLVEPETALAPLDFVQAEVSPFPKGHVAIATSWSDPASACALHTRFGEGKHRGPVRYHLDLEAELEEKDRPKPARPKGRRSAGVSAAGNGGRPTESREITAEGSQPPEGGQGR